MIEDLPEGLVTRPLTWDDVGSVFRIEAESEAFDDGEAELSLSDVESEWRRPAFDLATMSVGVFDADRLVGYAEVFRGRAEAVVAPAERGRGIGSALARWTWNVARASARDVVDQAISDTEHDAAKLFTSLGYERGHTAWILRITLDGEPPSPEVPDDVVFRAYRPGLDEPRMFEVIETAFGEWADREPNTYEDWRAQFLDRGDAPPELQVLAASGNRIVGVAINYDAAEDTEGWVQQLAVDAAHRRRGIGRALLQESFRRFHELGRRTCGLSTDSRTGALGLYERAGMRVRKSYTHWTKRL